jgi:hypothetical protein
VRAQPYDSRARPGARAGAGHPGLSGGHGAGEPEPATPEIAALREAPRDWQLLDAATDRVPGTGAERAERELLAGRQPKQHVVVAVIDGGVDTGARRPPGQPLDEPEGGGGKRQGRRRQRLRR